MLVSLYTLCVRLLYFILLAQGVSSSVLFFSPLSECARLKGRPVYFLCFYKPTFLTFLYLMSGERANGWQVLFSVFCAIVHTMAIHCVSYYCTSKDLRDFQKSSDLDSTLQMCHVI